MKKLLLFCVIVFGGLSTLFSQDNKSAIYAQFNTILVYSNFTLNYESKDIFSSFEKHSIKLTAGFGGWSTSAFNKNKGLLINYGLNYTFGSKAHLLEVDINFQNHFDKGLKEQPIVFVGPTIRPFIGYRFQPIEGKTFLKVGTGWREVFQIGFGYRF